MLLAALVLALVLVSCPVLPFVGGPVVQGGLLLATGAAVAALGLALPPGEAAHLRRSLVPLWLVAAVPALWMGVQLLPLGLGPNPIGTTAGAAAGPLAGAISLDPAATAAALARLLLAVGVVAVTAGLAVDRTRAEWILWGLTLATAAMALVAVVHDLTGATFLGPIGQGLRAGFDTAAALGVVVAAAAVDLAVERHETRRDAPHARVRLIERVTAAALAFGTCAFAVGYFLDDALPVATAIGLGLFGLIVLVRRIGAASWVGRGVLAVGLVILSMAIVSQWAPGGRPAAIGLAALPAADLAVTERMLADATWTGSGAGTFATLQAPYGDVAPPAPTGPPTLAAALEIELGRAAPWVALALALMLAGFLGDGALRRGRDSFYAAAAASGLVVLMLGAFRDASLLGLAPMLLAAVMLGLGLGQRQGRTAR